MNMETYLAQHTDRARSTQQACKLYVGKFERFRAGREITPALLDAYRGHVAHDTTRQNSTKCLELYHVAPYVAWMARQGLAKIDRADIRAGLKPFKTDSRPPVVLPRETIRAIAQAALGNDRYRFALALLLTGCRREELATFKIVGDNLHIWGVKNRRERVIPSPLFGAAGWAFIAQGRFRYQPRAWDALRASVGLTAPLKAFRSTWVSHAWYRGLLTPTQVASIAGHTMAVCEASYVGPLILGLTGDTIPEWLGIGDVLC